MQVEQYFGEDIEQCDHLPSETNVTITSGVGLSSSTSDQLYMNRLKEFGFDVEEFTLCSLNSCVEGIVHDEMFSSDGIEYSNAHVTKQLRAGPPNKVDPFLRTISIEVTGMVDSHTANILVCRFSNLND